ncbi:uncharacterized protein LOC130614426 [Hydractinia symbiolongicarpus]|uniref:uncharacterized protein LOC130614426 n=1 Tax=Hydractinia symbiolongicarpus TaxID=13093 RepID=UPI00254B7471|nr:uncharacterized protein LOC130614426 [Hydractinia symbiolongicarpus]
MNCANVCQVFCQQYWCSRCNYGSLDDEFKKIDDPKCIASTRQLEYLLGDTCHEKDCNAQIVNIESFYIGYTIKLTWKCLKGHKDFWYSSPIYGSGFVINYIVESALVLSGGQINQFSRFCKFVQLGKPNISTFYKNQKLYVSPAVQQTYDDIEHDIIESMSHQDEVIICGNCQLDSPGWSATKGTYTFMDHQSKKLVMMQFGDKREVNLQSTKLEVHLFMKGMKYLISKKDLRIDEICTDAHATIKCLMKKEPILKATHHSLDVWHKAGKITKKISQEVSKKKQLQPLINPWLAPIRNHFWYCCSHCEEDELKMRVLWMRLLKHITGDHLQCEHEPMEEPTEGKTWLDPTGPSMEIIRKHVMKSSWLKSFAYYTKNRHTGLLEAFHNLVLAYCPKRIGYKNDAYITRHQLAYLDFNGHLNRGQLQKKDGSLVYVRRYGKRTKQWFLVAVPKPKDYIYIRRLMAEILWRRHVDRGNVNRVGIGRECTKALRQNIAATTAPPMELLLEKHQAREEMKLQ